MIDSPTAGETVTRASRRRHSDPVLGESTNPPIALENDKTRSLSGVPAPDPEPLISGALGGFHGPEYNLGHTWRGERVGYGGNLEGGFWR